MSEPFDELQVEMKDLELSVKGLISEHKLLIHENNLLRARVEELSGALDWRPNHSDDLADAARDRDRDREFQRSTDRYDRGARD